METLWQDIRQGARTLAHNPAFAALAVLALALGIGPNTAIFSVVNALVLTPPPYQDPDTIVRITRTVTGPNGAPRTSSLSTDDFQDWRSSTRTLEQMALYVPDTLTLTGVGEPVRLTGSRVSPALFPLLRVQPLYGRTFSPDEEKPGNDRFILLSYAAWEGKFGGDRSIVGKSIKLDGADYAVVGVMKPGFAFPDRETQYWSPFTLTPPQRSGNERRVMMVPSLARLSPGTSVAEAEAEGTAVLERIRRADPEADPQTSRAQLHLVTLQEQIVGPFRPALRVLLAAVGFVLLIACANVASLLLSRGVDREREVSIRAALGAGRGRLVRQMLTESILLSLLGGAAGLVLGYWGVRMLLEVAPSDIPRLDMIRLDARVLGFTLAVSLLTGILFGIVPALKSARADVAGVLKQGGLGSVTGFRMFRNNRARSLLTVAEFALAVMLLVGAGLLVRSFLTLIGQNPGYDPRGVLTLQISLPRARYPRPENHSAFYDQLLGAVRNLPGVEAAGIVNLMPLNPAAIRLNFQIVGRPPASSPAEQPVSGIRLVSPGYFGAMAVPVRAGRDFTDRDREGAHAVLSVNESFARRYFPGENPLGQQIEVLGPREIVAVVGDVKPQGLDSEPQPEMYLPYGQFGRLLMMGGPLSAMNIVVRSKGDPLALVAPIRTKVSALDPQLPLFNISTMEKRVSDSVARPRFYASLLGIFAFLALALSAVGIYGVVSYHVRQSSREIGVRIALGARRRDVLVMVMGQSALLAAAGISAGLAGAWATSRFLASLLFGIAPTDPSTYVGIALLMVLVAAIAAFVPARRAATVDPVVALRCE